MKKLSLISFLFIIFCYTSFAEERIIKGSDANAAVAGAKLIRYTSQSTLPDYIAFAKDHFVKFNDFDTWVHTAFKMSSDYSFIQLAAEPDQIGFTHYRLQQTYKGVPIENSMLLLHVKGVNIESMNGAYYNSVNAASSPSLTEAAALNFALGKVNATVYKWQIASEEANIKIELNKPTATYYPKGNLVFVKKGNQYHLCYAFNIYAQKPLSRTMEYVDAATGQIIKTADLLKFADTPATAATQYSGTKNIVTDSFGGSYRLREAGRGNGINTYNCQTTTNYTNTDFTNTTTSWTATNAQLDEYATDAHFGAEATYDFYWNSFGRNSIDNLGFQLNNYVHYDVNFLNAFWDGTKMSFGDGSGAYTPLTSLDITGHEITHGLTEHTANLDYQNESGALNESFSDIFGVTIEHANNPTTWNWLIADNIGGAPFRSMSQPSAYGDPNAYGDANWYTGTGDNGGVHTNSGVQNHWYTILEGGDAATNYLGNSYNVTGIGFTKASAIAFRNLTVYLINTSVYADSRFYSILAASDLYGNCSAEVQATTDAWYAVAVGGAYVVGVTSNFIANNTVACAAPISISFTNLSNNGLDFTWDFGDGGSDTLPNPSHTYTANGNYSVTLIADGGACGIDTLMIPNYIVINSSNPCVNMPTTGIGTTQTNCFGFLFDNGGASNNYSDNANGTITIAPSGASLLSVMFSSFNTEAGYDSLEIFDGPTTASPRIAMYTGSALPNGGAAINSTGGSLTIRFKSDGGLNLSGFAMSWSCIYPTVPPIAAFTASPANSCNGVVHFTDASSFGPTHWAWDFGDGGTDTTQYPTYVYAANNTYTVQLIATNNYGSDTATYTNYITVARPTPGPTGIGGSTCTAGQVSLSATPVTSTNTINWYSSPSSTTVLGTGTAFVTPTISSTTNFYAEEEIPGNIDSLGAYDNSIGTGNNYTNNNDRYLVFDCSAACTLVSVKVISGAAGNRTIQLRDNLGTVIQSAVVNIPTGTSDVILNFSLPVGTGFELGLLSGGTVPAHNLYRNNAGAVFPYTAGPVSITGVNPGSPATYYYFFYNWKIQEAGCASVRTPVVATTGLITPYAGLTGTSTICSNDTAVITAVTGTGYTYQWLNNASPITGATNAVYSTSITGNYTCAISATGCATATTSPAIGITVNPAPIADIIQPATDTAYRCLGVPFTMKAQTGTGYFYQWYRNGGAIGSTVDSFTAITGGGLFINLYTVEVGSPGCVHTVLSAPFTLVSYTQPVAAITPNTDQILCKNQSLNLTANTGLLYTYQWMNNSTNIPAATNDNITVNAAGAYTVTINNGFCPASTSPTINVSLTTIHAAFLNTQGGLNISFSDASTGGATTWAWNFGDSQTDNTASPTHNYATSGSYTVQLIATDAGGCSDTTSKTIDAFPDGIGTIENANAISLYPNPAKESVVISLPITIGMSVGNTIQIYDVLGRLQNLEINKSTNQQIIVNVSTLAAGVYMVKINAGGSVVNKKLVVSK